MSSLRVDGSSFPDTIASNMSYLGECIEQGIPLRTRFARIRNHMLTAQHRNPFSHDALIAELLRRNPLFKSGNFSACEVDAGFVQISYSAPYGYRLLPEVLLYGAYDGRSTSLPLDSIREGRAPTLRFITDSLRGIAVVRAQL